VEVVNIQPGTAENRRGKKIERKKERRRRSHRAKYNGLPYRAVIVSWKTDY